MKKPVGLISLLTLVALVLALLLSAAGTALAGDYGPGQRRPTRTPNSGGGAAGLAGTATALAATAKAAGSNLVLTTTALAATAKAAGNSVALTMTPLAATAKAAGNSALLTATALAATANAIIGKVTPLAGDEAAQALTSYAAQVLGRGVTVTHAGGGGGSISQTIPQSPESQAAQNMAVSLAVKSYWGLLADGGATLSYGSGTLSGDVAVDVQGASLGVYSVVVAGSAADASTALSAALATYPALAGFTYTAYPTSTGYMWYAVGTVYGVDPQTREATLYAEAVYLYVVPFGQGQISVTATVGRGDFASALSAP